MAENTLGLILESFGLKKSKPIKSTEENIQIQESVDPTIRNQTHRIAYVPFALNSQKQPFYLVEQELVDDEPHFKAIKTKSNTSGNAAVFDDLTKNVGISPSEILINRQYFLTSDDQYITEINLVRCAGQKMKTFYQSDTKYQLISERILREALIEERVTDAYLIIATQSIQLQIADGRI